MLQMIQVGLFCCSFNKIWQQKQINSAQYSELFYRKCFRIESLYRLTCNFAVPLVGTFGYQ